MLDPHRGLPPFGQEVALQKLRAAEDGWNTRDSRRILLAYTPGSYGRERSEFVSDQEEIVAFLIRKWANELGGRLMRELWAWSGAKIAVHFTREWHASAGNWICSRRNDNGKFGANGLMNHRLACVSDFPIDEPDRMMRRGRSGPRAADHSGSFHFSSLTTGELNSERKPE